jgi:AcrR family transcriptional regulator
VTVIEPDEQELGLRERKKQRTRETIARVGLELFSEHGFHDTTLKEIADAADVSPRTVSAYFPAKEEIVFADFEALSESLSARLAEHREGETMADGLRDSIRSLVDATATDPERQRCLRELVESDPVLRTYERGLQERIEQIIASAVAVDLELEADDLLPRMVGAATIAALDALGREAKRTSAPVSEEGLVLLDDAMAFVGAGVQALAARRGVRR